VLRLEGVIMRRAAWALAPLSICHAVSIGLTAAPLSVVLPLCRGGTFAMDTFGIAAAVAVAIHIAGMLVVGGVIALGATLFVRCYARPATFAPFRNNASPSGAKWNDASRSAIR
jgi:hypothetical protein